MNNQMNDITVIRTSWMTSHRVVSRPVGAPSRTPGRDPSGEQVAAALQAKTSRFLFLSLFLYVGLTREGRSARLL